MMSRYDYEVSQDLAEHGHPFYALIMAAMRQADIDNSARLRAAFPDGWAELQQRYNAPGGQLPSERCTCTRCQKCHDRMVCAVCQRCVVCEGGHATPTCPGCPA